MFIKKIFLFSLFSMTLVGCGVYRSYERPAEIQMELSPQTNDQKEYTVNMVNLSWQEFFKDNQLQLIIKKGLDHNADLQIARLRIESAVASFRKSKMEYLPSVSLNPQGNITHGNKQTSQTYDLGVNLSWELDIFGKITNEKRLAESTVEERRAYEQAVKSQLIATIAQSYYTLVEMDMQLIIQKKTLRNWEKSISVTETLARNGLCDDTAVLQAQANKLSLESSVSQLTQQISEAENSLCLLLGVPDFMVERGTDIDLSIDDNLSAGIPLQELSNRPDIRQAESILKQSFYSVNIARSAFYPTLNLSGSLGWTNKVGGAVLNPGTWVLNAIGSITQPLFAKGANSTNLKIAKNNQKEALINFQQAILKAGNEVNDALTKYQSTRKQCTLMLNRIDILNQTVSKTELLMRRSNHTYLEVLTAQQSLLDAEMNRVSLQYEQAKVGIELYRALGGGCD